MSHLGVGLGFDLWLFTIKGQKLLPNPKQANALKAKALSMLLYLSEFPFSLQIWPYFLFLSYQVFNAFKTIFSKFIPRYVQQRR